MKVLDRPIGHLLVPGLFVMAWFSVIGAAQSLAPAHTAIDGVIAADAKVELIRGGFKGVEGPVGTPDGQVYFTDIPANRIYRLEKNGEITVWRENTQGANGLFLAQDGRLLVAEMNSHRVVAITQDGRVTPLVTEVSGKPLRSPNDLVLDKKGGIYFTEHAFPLRPGENGNVYYRRPNGEVLLLDDQFEFPNGVMMSLDEKTLYLADPLREDLYAFDIQPDGSVKNRRVFVTLLEPTKGPNGQPRSGADGMAVDSQERLYVATSAGIQVIDRRGTHLGIIRVPATGSRARNLGFGGPRRQTLYIAAVNEMYRVQVLSRGPAKRSR